MRFLAVFCLLFLSLFLSAQVDEHPHDNVHDHEHDHIHPTPQPPSHPTPQPPNHPTTQPPNHPTTQPPKLSIQPIDGPVPWTSLNLNNDPNQFQFAIVTDRTGGHRPGVFMDAVNKLNLLQPEFVMSVGDLIEGYTTDMDELNRQWDEFDGFVKQLDMPFFYLPGNHDITNQIMEDLWKKRLGPTHYHFVYNNILFLALNSEDQRQGAGRGTISDEQFKYIEKALAENADVDWTLVFMHQPLWNQKDTRRWKEVEALLKNRKHTVYTGHEHRYVKYKRNNANYYVLATTGGGSSLRGPSLGEFDHVVWITMTKEGPIMANLLLEGIWDENVFTEANREFVGRLDKKPPIVITPFYTDDTNFTEGKVNIKITNDENVPMQVVFDERFSDDVIGLMSHRAVTVPPNSVEKVTMTLQKRNNKMDRPMTVHATVTYQFESSEIELPYHFNIKPLPKRTLPKRKGKRKIDGNAKDWKSFPYEFSADNGDMKARFDICYDDKFVYFAAEVDDDTINTYGKGAVWTQDNVGFGFSALPTDKSAMSVGQHWYSQEMYQLISPESGDIPSRHYRKMPKGSEIKCVTTDSGYFMEAKVPVSYIIKKQGKNWKTIRLVVVVDDKDGKNTNRYWWQPNWMNTDVNVVGSGMFFRE